MKILRPVLACAGLLAASPLPASVLWSETFDRLPPGPLAPGLFDSNVIHADCAATVVADAPGRQSLHLQDGSDAGRVLLERNFVAAGGDEPVVRLRFTVRKLPSQASAETAAFLVGLGSFARASSSHLVVGGGQNRTLDIRFRADGRLVVSNGSAALSTPPSQLLAYPPEGLEVNLYANAGRVAIELPSAPDGARHRLAPGRFGVWIGQSRVVIAGRSDFEFFNVNETGFGRVGFFTGNANSERGLAFAIDDISVSRVDAP